MAETTKTKVIDIQTGKAQKGVKSLKQVIKELRDEMALLEKGTAEYDAMSKKLADAMQKQREIAEAAKYSNKDIGATLGNIATIGAGAVGAINGVSAALQLVGVEGEDAEKALKNIQLTMALIQGLSSIDTALKAVKGLSVAFKGLNAQRTTNTGTTFAAAGSETAEAAALKDNTKKTYDNIEAANKYNTAQIENTTETNKSTEALYKEAGGLEAVAAARQGDMTKLEQYRAELASLEAQQAAATSNAQNIGFTKAIEEYERRIRNLTALLEHKRSLMPEDVIKDTEQKIQRYQDALGAMLMTSTTTSQDIVVAVDGALNKLINSSHSSFEELEEDVHTFNELLKGLPFDTAQEKAQEANDFFQRCIASFQIGVMQGEEGVEEALKDFTDIQYILGKETSATLETIQKRELEEKALKAQIDKTTKSINAETAAENANADAKKRNTKETQNLTNKEKDLNGTMNETVPVQGKVTKGFKDMAKGIRSFIAANPVILVIAGAIAGLAVILSEYTRITKENNKEKKLNADINAEANKTYFEQITRLRTLKKTAMDETEGLEERRKAVEELNKIVPEYNAQIDETTGKYTANTKALKDYCENLMQKIKLEAYEGKIKEYLEQQLEQQLKINKIANSGWNVFGLRIDRARKKIKELDKDIDFMWQKIKELDLSKALDDNKVETPKTVKTVTKTVKELMADIKKLFKDFWGTTFDLKELRKIWHGVYNETDMAMLNLKKVIKTNLADGYLSKEFKKALEEGFPEDMSYKVTIDWVLDDKQYKSTLKKMKLLEENIRTMMADPKRYEKEIPAQQKHLEKLKEQAAAYKAVLEATQNYFDVRRKQAEAEEKRIDLQDEYLRKLEIERTYRYEQRSGNTYADINKEIALNELLVEQLNKKKQARDGELAALQALKKKYDEDAEQAIKNGEEVSEERVLQTKIVVERIKELNQQEIDDEKSKTTALANIDEQNYQTRLKYVEEYYEKAKEQAEASTAELENNRTLKGWGVQDYNTQLDILKMSLQAIKDTMEETSAYYDMQIALAADNAERRIELEAEKLEALRQLNADYAAQEIEIEKAKVDRKIAIQQTYTNAMDSITGEIQSLLQTQMANYDQNSKQYKKLAVANGIIDVTKGTLSAFMSGIESGVPAPWNLVVAGVMSALVFATGMAQLNNIKNATAANATSGSSNISFGSYDTMTYAQNSDILSSISDQRVYVLESDITSTQNRVQVTESNATF